MKLNIATSLEISWESQIYQWFSKKMQEWRVKISSTGLRYVTLTTCFGVYESLLWIPKGWIDTQQSIGIKLCFWKRLQVWFWFCTFYHFFQVLFGWFFQPLALNFVPLPSICIMECIRSRIMVQIFSHHGLHIWFDFHLKTCQIGQKTIFLHMILCDTNFDDDIGENQFLKIEKISCNQVLGFDLI